MIQAGQLHQDLKQVMRCFGRQCRGQGKVLVKLVRQSEKQLLELGQPIGKLAQSVQQCLQEASHLRETTRERLASQLRVAMTAHQQISKQSHRLTQGKRLTQCKIVNAYDPTIAPICKGKSNCPTQFGRKPGIISGPAEGFVCAVQLPVGAQNWPSTRWRGIWGSMPRRSITPFTREGFSPSALPRRLSR
jgi:regulator of replication initiation timing